MVANDDVDMMMMLLLAHGLDLVAIHNQFLYFAVLLLQLYDDPLALYS